MVELVDLLTVPERGTLPRQRLSFTRTYTRSIERQPSGPFSWIRGLLRL